MIRREIVDPVHGLGWIFVSQVDHARLAGELARDWTRPLVMWPEVNDELLATIDHHDDGWREWEAAPRVDPASGRPLQFTEMPLDQALAIWQRSIDTCRGVGPLAAWLVAGHFSALLRHANAWQRTDHPQSALATEFLRRQDTDRIAWFREWQLRDPRRNALAVAENCLRWLQFFDALSLWFCCAERRQPETITGVEPASLQLTPQTTEHIGLSPWPMRAATASHSVPGLLMKPGRYPDGPLQGDPVTLSWRLTPAN